MRFIAAVLLGVAVTAACAETLTGRVVRVHDGDTLTVLDSNDTQHRVRLAGIDAPELKQPFGRVSQTHLASLVSGKSVTVTWHKRDKYGRIVGKVSNDSVPDVGFAQINAGVAWHYLKYANEQTPEDRARYAAAERQARAARGGLWQEAAVAPWEFRRVADGH